MLEQWKESHLANMQSMGIPISKRLIISDFSEYRQKFDHKTQDIIGMIETNIMLFKCLPKNKVAKLADGTPHP